ncbi:hypothetical protein [Mesorhizobium ciceri]|uniref:hypothetical protein n=1 Tax=Mesorhizobium TaxID=68287 RepID=UPI00047E41E7|nr:hypothetical protein [Mesorhizobium ciceri]
MPEMSETIFWQVLAAVLGANLLTVCFVWGVFSYSKLEQQGRANEATRFHFFALVAPMFFALGALMVAFNSVPAWLDTILQ